MRRAGLSKSLRRRSDDSRAFSRKCHCLTENYLLCFFASNLSKHIFIDTIRMARRQEKKADVHVCAGKAAAQPFLDIGPSIESSIMPCLCYKQAFFALIKKA